MLQVKCLCGHHFPIHDDEAGRPVRCPACGVRQVAEAHRTSAAPPESAAPAPVGPPQRTTNSLAITSLVLGLLSLVCGLVSGITVFLGVPAIITGLMALGRIKRSEGRQTGRGLALTGVITGALGSVWLVVLVVAVSIFVVQGMHEASRQMESANNLRVLALAVQNYDDTYHCFPPQATLVQPDPTQLPQPGVSWRVLLLPYMEQEALYKEFDLGEPWDSPKNRKASSTPVKVFQLPGDTTTPPDETYYQVFYGDRDKKPHALFDKPEGPNLMQASVRITTIMDGMTNTILFAEAVTPVPWAKPADLYFDNDLPPPALGHHFAVGHQAVTADGKVRTLPFSIPASDLKALITRDGGEIIYGEDY